MGTKRLNETWANRAPTELSRYSSTWSTHGHAPLHASRGVKLTFLQYSKLWNLPTTCLEREEWDPKPLKIKEVAERFAWASMSALPSEDPTDSAWVNPSTTKSSKSEGCTPVPQASTHALAKTWVPPSTFGDIAVPAKTGFRVDHRDLSTASSWTEPPMASAQFLLYSRTLEGLTRLAGAENGKVVIEPDSVQDSTRADIKFEKNGVQPNGERNLMWEMKRPNSGYAPLFQHFPWSERKKNSTSTSVSQASGRLLRQVRTPSSAVSFAMLTFL